VVVEDEREPISQSSQWQQAAVIQARPAVHEQQRVPLSDDIDEKRNPAKRNGCHVSPPEGLGESASPNRRE
jgi:hypothetical protein